MYHTARVIVQCVTLAWIVSFHTSNGIYTTDIFYIAYIDRYTDYGLARHYEFHVPPATLWAKVKLETYSLPDQSRVPCNRTVKAIIREGAPPIPDEEGAAYATYDYIQIIPSDKQTETKEISTPRAGVWHLMIYMPYSDQSEQEQLQGIGLNSKAQCGVGGVVTYYTRSERTELASIEAGVPTVVSGSHPFRFRSLGQGDSFHTVQISKYKSAPLPSAIVFSKSAHPTTTVFDMMCNCSAGSCHGCVLPALDPTLWWNAIAVSCVRCDGTDNTAYLAFQYYVNFTTSFCDVRHIGTKCDIPVHQFMWGEDMDERMPGDVRHEPVQSAVLWFQVPPGGYSSLMFHMDLRKLRDTWPTGAYIEGCLHRDFPLYTLSNTNATVSPGVSGCSLTVSCFGESCEGSVSYLPYGKYFFTLRSMQTGLPLVPPNTTSKMHIPTYEKPDGPPPPKHSHVSLVNLGEMDVYVADTYCIDGCNGNGDCRQSQGLSNIFYYCFCQRPYQGWTCMDEDPVWTDEARVSLLIGSNTAFLIPALVAFYRQWLSQGLLYTMVAFASASYHACDSNIAHWCLMKDSYGWQAIADVGLAMCAMWSTVVLLARLDYKWTKMLEVCGSIVLLLAAYRDCRNAFVNGAPFAAGFLLITGKWIWISWRTRIKKCFNKFVRNRTTATEPLKFGCSCCGKCGRCGKFFSKLMYWRYFRWKFFIPAVVSLLLACSVYSFLETDYTYGFTHSLWHVCVATSLFFFLLSMPSDESATNVAELRGLTQRLQELNCHEHDAHEQVPLTINDDISDDEERAYRSDDSPFSTAALQSLSNAQDHDIRGTKEDV